MITTIRVGDNDLMQKAKIENRPTKQAKIERGSERMTDNDKDDHPTIKNLKETDYYYCYYNEHDVTTLT